MALFMLLKIALVAFVAGIGPYIALVRGRWRHPWMVYSLIPNLGLGSIAFISVHLIYFDIPVRFSIPIAIGVSITLLLGFAALGFRSTAGSILQLTRRIRTSLGYSALLFTGSLMCFSPSLIHGGAQPYRVGVDQIGYATTAEYLKNGGTLSDLRAKALYQSGHEKLDSALNANMTYLNFNLSTACEFLLKSQRSGYPAVLAATLSAIGVEHVISAQFLILFFPIYLLASLSAVFLRTDLRCSRIVTCFWVLACIFNCNFLNVLYEGQHAQIYTAPIFALIFLIWWHWRRTSVTIANLFRSLPSDFPLCLFAFAILYATYSEQVVVLGSLAAIVAILDSFLSPKRFNTGNAWLLLASLLGLLVTGRYGFSWLSFILRHAAHVAEGVSGFPQPQWAQVTDILGLNDIYTIAAPKLLGRPLLTTLILGLISLGLCEFCLWILWRRCRKQFGFWIAPLIFISLIFARSYYITRTINYNYMKSYTLLLFPLTVLAAWLVQIVVSHLDSISGRISNARRIFVSTVLPILPAAVVFATGLGYLARYSRNGHFLPKTADAFANRRVCEILRNNAVLTLHSDSLPILMLSGYCDMNWLNLGWSDPFLPPHSGKKIFLLITRFDRSDFKSIADRCGNQAYYRNADFLLLDTGRTVRVPDSQLGLNGLKPSDHNNSKGYWWPLELTPIWRSLIDESLGKLTG